jgi:hypothetical protein
VEQQHLNNYAAYRVLIADRCRNCCLLELVLRGSRTNTSTSTQWQQQQSAISNQHEA